MEPLYKIGEVVIRQAPSTNHPQYNGEYEVCGIITTEEFRALHPFVNAINDFYYELVGFSVPLTFSISHHSSEKFLKKKHLPSSESFDKLMSSLKQPQRV